MSTRTKHEDVRGELKTDIEAQLSTDGLTAVFTKYPPVGDYSREDRVWLGEINFSQEPYTYGNYQELIDVDFVVDCPTSGGSQDEWEEGAQRAEAILDSILAALRSDITINATVFNVELGESSSVMSSIDENGPHGRIEGTLNLEAHV